MIEAFYFYRVIPSKLHTCAGTKVTTRQIQDIEYFAYSSAHGLFEERKNHSLRLVTTKGESSILDCGEGA
jgi:hypothetical protein